MEDYWTGVILGIFIISIKAYSSLKPHNEEIGRLETGQQQRQISDHCIELDFNVYSSSTKAAVEIYADRACKNRGISKQEVNITFLPCTCPVGFEQVPSDVNCKCTCDKILPSTAE